MTTCDTTTDSRPLAGQQIPPEILRLFEPIFAPGDRVLVRLIETWTEAGQKKTRVLWKETRYWTHSHPEWNWGRLLDTAERENANVFFGVCPRFGPGSEEAGRFDQAWQIRTVRVLWADLDNCTAEEALERVQKSGLPAPSAVVNSGNGVHLYWFLSEPWLIDDAGDLPAVRKEFVSQGAGKKLLPRAYILDDTGEKVYQFQANSKRPNAIFPRISTKGLHLQDVVIGIALAIGGDHTTDLARLLRVPGTLNRKDQRNGQEPRPCVLAECWPDRRYPFADFERFAQDSPERKKREAVNRMKLHSCKLTPGRRNTLSDLANRCALAPPGLRSEADFALCCWAVEQGIGQEETWGAVADVGKFAQRGRPYFDLTWEKAQGHTRERIYHRHQRRQRQYNPPVVACETGADETAFVSSYPNAPEDRESGESPGSQVERVEILVTPDRHEVARQVACALAGDDELFVRDDKVVRVRERFTPQAIGTGRLRFECPAGTVALQQAEPAFVEGRITSRVILLEEHKEAGLVQVHPSPWLTPHVQACPGPIRRVYGVLSGPTIRPDGTVINTYGYDPATCYFQARPLPDLAVIDKPTLEDAKQAEQSLWNVVDQFPWETRADYARWLTLLVTAVIRHLLDKVPMGLVNANVAGAGKSRLCELISVIVHGTDSPILMTWPDGSHLQQRGDELRKRLASLLEAGATLALVDNLPRGEPLDSPELCAFLTRNAFTDRKLGQNDGAFVGGLNRCLLLASGNEVWPSGDSTDRVLVVRLLSPHENPRALPPDHWKIPNLLRHCRDNRPALLGAVLTIVRAWIAEGEPHPAGESLGTFERWAETAVAIVRWLGLPDPLGNRVERAGEHDDESISLKKLLAGWHDVVHEGFPLSAKRIIDAIESRAKENGTLGEKAEAMQEAIFSLLGPRSKGWPPTSATMGRLLTAYEGRRVLVAEGRWLALKRSSNSHTKGWDYSVVTYETDGVVRGTADPTGVAGDAGVCGGCYAGSTREETPGGFSRV